jgi:hypothetical protein
MAVAVAPGAAFATAPGRNGQIAFRRYLGPDRTKGTMFVAARDGTNADGTGRHRVTETEKFLNSDIWTIHPDGTGLRQVTHAGPPDEGVLGVVRSRRHGDHRRDDRRQWTGRRVHDRERRHRPHASHPHPALGQRAGLGRHGLSRRPR